MHQPISTMIAISLRENPPSKHEDISSMLIHRKCMAAQYAVRATVHTTLQHTHSELAFTHDMRHPFSPVRLIEYIHT